MSARARIIASGPGWRVADVVCTATPRERPFEEEHESVCVALVTSGTFRYRASHGTAILSPGSILLGNPGNCFECGHDHSRGDRCLAFHFHGDLFERITAVLPGAKTDAFQRASLPALPRLAAIAARAEAMRDAGDAVALGELALEIAAEALTTANDHPPIMATPTGRDERRVSDAVRLIESDADQTISLQRLAGETATSPYHFLRSFRAVTGMTPYQYLLRTRLHRAAVRLKTSDEAVSSIAYEAGFNDLATFNRRFRKIIGQPPTVYRRGRRLASSTIEAPFA